MSDAPITCPPSFDVARLLTETCGVSSGVVSRKQLIAVAQQMRARIHESLVVVDVVGPRRRGFTWVRAKLVAIDVLSRLTDTLARHFVVLCGGVNSAREILEMVKDCINVLQGGDRRYQFVDQTYDRVQLRDDTGAVCGSIECIWFGGLAYYIQNSSPSPESVVYDLDARLTDNVDWDAWIESGDRKAIRIRHVECNDRDRSVDWGDTKSSDSGSDSASGSWEPALEE